MSSNLSPSNNQLSLYIDVDKKKKHWIVVESNDLIEASYNLSDVQQKAVVFFLSLPQKDNPENNIFRFSMADFIRATWSKSHNSREYVKKLESLKKEDVYILKNWDNPKERSIISLSWISSIEFFVWENNKWMVEVELSQKLMPYLTQLKSDFTLYNLENAWRLKWTYAPRIYKFLKRYQKIWSRVMTLHELKEKLWIINPKTQQVQIKSFNTFWLFNKKILQEAQKQINKNTDIYFDFEMIKESRSVVAIKFNIIWNSRAGINTTKLWKTELEEQYWLSENQVIIVNNLKARFTKLWINTVINLFDDYPIDRIKSSIYKYDELYKKWKIKSNPEWFFLTILKNEQSNILLKELKDTIDYDDRELANKYDKDINSKMEYDTLKTEAMKWYDSIEDSYKLKIWKDFYENYLNETQKKYWDKTWWDPFYKMYASIFVKYYDSNIRNK